MSEFSLVGWKYTRHKWEFGEINQLNFRMQSLIANGAKVFKLKMKESIVTKLSVWKTFYKMMSLNCDGTVKRVWIKANENPCYLNLITVTRSKKKQNRKKLQPNDPGIKTMRSCMVKSRVEFWGLLKGCLHPANRYSSNAGPQQCELFLYFFHLRETNGYSAHSFHHQARCSC